MKKMSNRILKLFLIVSVALAAVSAANAEVKLELQVSDTSLEMGDEMTVQLKADGVEGNAVLLLPKVDGLMFRQLGTPSSSSQTTIINGKVSRFSGLVFNIGISASKKGLYQVPGIGISYQNQSYPGEPFTVRVVSPDAQSSMKVSLSVSRKQVFPDEPVIIMLKWYLQDSIQDYTFRFPLLEQKDRLQLQLEKSAGAGATRELNVSGYTIPFQQEKESIGAEQYTVYHTSLRVYPSEPGPFNIPAASVRAMVKRGTELKRDFFNRLVRAPKLQRIFAVSDALSVQVRELPEKGRPAWFTGGIGSFNIQLSSKQTRVRIGDPIELSIRISGQGRLSKIEQPVLTEIPEIKDNFVVVDNLQPGDILEDSITFRQVVRARDETVTRIPPIRFAYFDPQQEQYMTVESNEISIKVLPSKQITDADIIMPKENRVAGETSLLRQNRGIYGNYTFADALSSQERHPAWFLLFIIPPLIYFTLLFLVRRYRRLSNNLALVRSRSARGKSSRRLKKARKMIAAEGSLFLAELSRSLSGYISDKFNLGAGEVTAHDIGQLSSTHGLTESLSKELVEHYELFDRLRFSDQEVPAEDRQTILTAVEKSISMLEKQL